MGLVHVERIEDVLGMGAAAWARVITEYVFDSIAKEEKENKDMNTVTNNNGDTFKVGDRVKCPAGHGHGTITSITALVNLSKPVDGTTITVYNLHSLTHYDGPTDAEDAWERVTMDIAVKVENEMDSWGAVDERDRRNMRHEAYIVLGSVLKIDEAIKQRVRGIIERAEKRFNGQN